MVEVAATKEMMTHNSRHPFQTFMMIFCVIIGLPIVFGRTPAPASIEAILHPTVVLFWGGALTVGGVLSLLGSALKNRVSGLMIEQLGLVFVGVATILYSVAIALAIGLSQGGAYPAAINFVFGASCLVRWRQIQTFLKRLSELQNNPSKGVK